MYLVLGFLCFIASVIFYKDVELSAFAGGLAIAFWLVFVMEESKK